MPTLSKRDVNRRISALEERKPSAADLSTASIAQLLSYGYDIVDHEHSIIESGGKQYQMKYFADRPEVGLSYAD
jgi:hypothetical protein